MNERQREPGNAILPAECSLMEETAAFEALFPCGRTVRDSFDGLRIALCTEGAMRIEVDGIGHELERGQLLCLTPSRRIRVESHTAELRLRMLSFSFDFLAGQPFLLRASVSEAMEQSPCIAPDRQAWRSLSELFDPVFGPHPPLFRRFSGAFPASQSPFFAADVWLSRFFCIFIVG